MQTAADGSRTSHAKTRQCGRTRLINLLNPVRDQGIPMRLVNEQKGESGTRGPQSYRTCKALKSSELEALSDQSSEAPSDPMQAEPFRP